MCNNLYLCLFFYGRTAFDMGKNVDRKPTMTVDAEIQTESSNRFRLDSSDTERKDNTYTQK